MKKEIDKFSIVIPLYNKEKEIERTIQSVLNQTIENFELIVINDGSKDSSPQKVSKFKDSRIRLISQSNKGVSSARNSGIKNANNSLIAFLDADDEWTPYHLETLLRLRKNYPDAGMYGTAYKVVLENDKVKESLLTGIPESTFEGLIDNYFRQSLYGDLMNASSLCIPKWIFSEVGYFLTTEVMGEDLDMWGRVALKYPVAFSASSTVIYYLNAENRACKKFNRTKFRISPFVKTVKKEMEAGNIPIEMRSDVNNYIAYLKLLSARAALSQGRSPQVAKQILKETIATDKTLKRTIHFYKIVTYIPEFIYIYIVRFRDFMNLKSLL